MSDHPEGCACRGCWYDAKKRGEVAGHGSREWRGQPRTMRVPCLYEGPVVEFAACRCLMQAERKHVRVCKFDGADWDNCCRGPAAEGSGVQSCAACPHHTEAKGG